MPTQADIIRAKILEYLASCPDGANFTTIMDATGKSSSMVSYVLGQMVKKGDLTSPEKGIYQIVTGSQPAPTPPAPAPAAAKEELGSPMKEAEIMEPVPAIKVPDAYDKFLQICKSCGIRDDFAKSVTDHIFLGDVYNLNEVWDNLQGMYLRPDVTKRIFNFWSRVINQPVPTDIVPQVMPSKTETGKEAEVKAPTRFTLVGEEIVADPEGEFTFSQARQYLMTKAISQVVPGTGAEKVSEIIGAIRPFLQEQRDAKAEDAAKQGEQSVLATIVSKLIEERGGGGQQPMTLTDMLTIVDKIDEARRTATATVLASTAKKEPTDAFGELERMVNVFDKLKNMFGGGSGANPVTIAIKSANGEQGVIPLDTYFKLEDHQRKVRQEDDEFENKKETGKAVRGFLDRISKAAANLTGR